MVDDAPDDDPIEDKERASSWRNGLERALAPSAEDRAIAGPPMTWRTVAIAALIPAFFLMLVLVVHFAWDVDFADVSQEPTITLEGPPLTGVQSNIGVLVMWLAVGVCLFTFAVLRRLDSPPFARRFFLWAGLITAMLAIDDMFLVHDQLIYESTGVNERRTFLVYVAVVAVFLWLYRRLILASGGALIIISILLLGASLAVDQTPSSLWNESVWRIFVEDGLKLLGLMFWSTYFIRRSYFAIVGATAGARANS